jgi:proteasome assembly chaperone (PAC2) family protein
VGEFLTFDSVPKLNRPVLVMAFEGWNDAADSASRAVSQLVDKLGGREFATIDPEEFYNFTESRPHVKWVGDARELRWPANRFFFARRGDGGDQEDQSRKRDLVLMRGVEPQLKWRAFCGLFGDVVERTQVSMVVSLGALLAEVPHTRPIRVTGGSTDPELASLLGLERSNYEGPTGIVGVLHQFLRDKGLPAVSLWANVPHYIPAYPNPRATAALLTRVSTLLDLSLDLAEMDDQAAEFDREINRGLEQNPEVADYVHELESRSAEDSTEVAPTELPSAESLVVDLEKFLRAQRESGE